MALTLGDVPLVPPVALTLGDVPLTPDLTFGEVALPEVPPGETPLRVADRPAAPLVAPGDADRFLAAVAAPGTLKKGNTIKI